MPSHSEFFRVRLCEGQRYQTIGSFGVSGGWWAQYMGLWTDPWGETGHSAREELALRLFDRDAGIGLTSYRYNLGAGSAESGKGLYQDPHRRAQTFEATPNGLPCPGRYDWEKDAGARWMLQEALRLGVREVTLFAISPLERLTLSGTAQNPKGAKSNIAPENLPAWARYLCDVTEHFVRAGVPVRLLSPINEPQWDWWSGQEGCHFEPEAAADAYEAVLKELNDRPTLVRSGVTLSGPESGEWGGRTREYVQAMLNRDALRTHFTTLDCHSYWTDAQTKEAFRRWLDETFPGVSLRMSEWCEMVNGTDEGMTSALVLARTLAEDLRILGVVSWAAWVGVSPWGYHDGLLHACLGEDGVPRIQPLKRLWAYGCYTRHIRPGFTRIAAEGTEACCPVAFLGQEKGRELLVVVALNEAETPRTLRLDNLPPRFSAWKRYEASAHHNGEQVETGAVPQDWTLPPQSVNTLTFEANKAFTS